MRSAGGYPARVGKIGTMPISGLAESALEMAPRRKPIAVMLDESGTLWLDKPEDANVRELLGVFDFKHDPDALAEEIRFEAKCRGLL